MICLCLNTSSLHDNTALIRENLAYIDLVELRVDLLDPAMRASASFWDSIKQWATETGTEFTNSNGVALPIIFTIRLPQDGGKWQADEYMRRKLLQQAVQSRLFRWIDIESNFDEIDAQTNITLECLIALSNSEQAQLVISEHHFIEPKIKLEENPEQANQNTVANTALDDHTTLPTTWYANILNIAKKWPEVLVKSAVTCTTSSMLCDFFEQCLELQHIIPKQYIAVSMGIFGIPGRILTAYTGSLWTYCSDVLGHGNDPKSANNLAYLGQLSPHSLVELYSYASISRNSKLYAIVGNPVMHSQSPVFHNKVFKEQAHAQLTNNKVYIHLPLDNTNVLPRLCFIINFWGFSVTIPYKERVCVLLDYSEAQVEFSQSCNTIVIDDNKKWHGYNTDINGFLSSLYEVLTCKDSAKQKVINKDANIAKTSNIDIAHIARYMYTNKLLRGYNICIIGAGGTAKALSYALATSGAKLLIVNRTVHKAQLLAQQLTQYFESQLLVLETQAGDTAENLAVSNNQSPAIAGTLTDYKIISQYSDIIVQTTSLGMHSKTQTPLPNFIFTGKEIVYDVIYTPPRTKLLQEAQLAGCTVLSGEAMFLVQAQLQSRLFEKVPTRV